MDLSHVNRIEKQNIAKLRARKYVYTLNCVHLVAVTMFDITADNSLNLYRPISLKISPKSQADYIELVSSMCISSPY